MNELITRLTEKAGISTEQAHSALNTIKDFVKEKFPMMAGAVDNLFAGSDTEHVKTDFTAIVDPEAPKAEEHGMLDKISDVIPGKAGEKIEEFIKDAAEKTEDVYDKLKEKVSDFLGGDKK